MNNIEIKYLILFLLLFKITSAQDHPVKREYKTETEKVVIPVKHVNSVKNILTNSDLNREINIKFKKELLIQENNYRHFQNKRAGKYSFDIISSVGRNINFGGIWERNAVMNFSPSMFIQPTDFINIFSNYRLSSFIPLTDLNTNQAMIRSFAIQSAVMMAVDNSVKLLLNSDSWISGLIEYGIKNLVVFYLIKPAVKNNNAQTIPWAEDEYFYYSVNIRF